ncbi:MAG: CopG family transcriptional regulator [Candidatus Bipolaricaulaceae bacterium]
MMLTLFHGEKRTQIYLEPELHRRLKERAKEEGISLAELLRRIARDYLRKGTSPEDYLSIVGLGKSGRTDVSEKHDEYLAQKVSNENPLPPRATPRVIRASIW